MLHPATLLEYPEDEPELELPSLPAGPLKTRRRAGVGINKLTIISITEAGLDPSTTLTSTTRVRVVSSHRLCSMASQTNHSLQKRKSNLNSLSLPLSAVVGLAQFQFPLYSR